jgi:hypothetical protein
MGKIFVILIVLLCNICFANMASPMRNGTSLSTVFTSKNIDILNEKIYFKPDKEFKTGIYLIEYHIKTDTSGKQIPLLFFALDYKENFKVYVDNIEIQLAHGINIYKHFNLLSKNDEFIESNLELGEQEFMVTRSSSDLKYFEVFLNKGEHTIRVEYTAFVWTYNAEWLKEYSFRYSLSPAKYWKSFGGLDIIIDNRAFKKQLQTNLGKAHSGSLDSIASWHFDKLPSNFLMVSHIPKVNSLAVFLIKISPEGLTVIFALILFSIHSLSVRKFRQKNPNVRFSWVSIAGSLISPLIILLVFLFSYDLIDAAIGPDATNNHGYLFLAILLYLPLMPVYLIIMQSVDYYFKTKFNKNK